MRGLQRHLESVLEADYGSVLIHVVQLVVACHVHGLKMNCVDEEKRPVAIHLHGATYVM